MTEVGRFHWADYLVFSVVMMISAGVGIFFGFKDRRKVNTEDFLMAGRNMNILPVSMSLFVRWVSNQRVKKSWWWACGNENDCKYGLIDVCWFFASRDLLLTLGQFWRFMLLHIGYIKMLWHLCYSVKILPYSIPPATFPHVIMKYCSISMLYQNMPVSFSVRNKWLLSSG